MFVLMYWSWMREINIIECGQRMENELEWLASKYVDTFTIGIQSKKIKNKWAKLLCAIQNMVKKQQDLKFSFFSIANRMKEDKLRYENLNCFVLLPFFHFVGKLMISLEEMWWNREKNEEGKLRAFVLSIRPFKKNDAVLYTSVESIISIRFFRKPHEKNLLLAIEELLIHLFTDRVWDFPLKNFCEKKTFYCSLKRVNIYSRLRLARECGWINFWEATFFAYGFKGRQTLMKQHLKTHSHMNHINHFFSSVLTSQAEKR